MIGYLDILLEMADNEDVKRLILKEQEIVTKIRHLADLSREYEGIGMNHTGFIDVDAVIYKILASPEFTGKVDAHRALTGLFVYADRMFEKVIFELVENSLAYGGIGVTIRFSYLKTEEGIIIVIEDNGPGIEDDEKKYIFSRSSRHHGGEGLFLATEILDITGIRIRETGTAGSGARFEIVIPPDGYRSSPGTP
jgi:signal transduction histidine kinase